MVGDIGQPTHLHYDMFLFLYDRISSYKCMLVLTLFVTYAICDMIPFFFFDTSPCECSALDLVPIGILM